ncbi:MAG TPA: acyl-CoA desaturase [Pirellulales bacterium]|nr:acyl-CoA desaturase [Pirellulales bacterium]
MNGLQAQTLSTAPGEPIKFRAGDGFQQALRRRVEAYFETTGRRERDCPRMYLKTALILVWFAASYIALVFFLQSWWLAPLVTVSLGLSMAAIGFNIQHDGGHHAYSSRPWVNKLMAMSLDLLGGSSYVWNKKHNVVHHSFSNITGHDDDINIGVLGRLSPHQERRKFHRLQHFYLWALYGLLPIKWQLYDDFRDVLIGRIGRYPLARPKGWDLVTFIAGKMTFLTLALVVPLCLHPLWVVLPFYVAATFVQGVVLSVVFQMAHCVEDAAFPLPGQDSGRIETAWAEHQVETTVDFGRGNWLLSTFVGGLNFQIEHHLFPRVCHLHYPALARLVEETCREFGVRYTAHETFLACVASHFRWLRRMGMAPSS